MVDINTSTVAETVNQSQQNCPLMKLPVELRLRIYKFAFKDIVDDILADASSKKRRYQEADEMWPAVSVGKAEQPICVGVLSLLHVGHELRRECLDALSAPTRASRNVCFDHHKARKEAYHIPVLDQYGNFRKVNDFLHVRRLLYLEHNEALHRL